MDHGKNDDITRLPRIEGRDAAMPDEYAKRPQIGEHVRYGKPGPVLLTIERVGVYEYPRDAWNVVAGGMPMLVRADGEDGIPWQRVPSLEGR